MSEDAPSIDSQPKRVFRTITITVSGFDVVLRPLTLGGGAFLESLDFERTSAREIAAQVIHYHLVEPKRELDELRSWTDDDLAYTAITWARASSAISRRLDVEEASLEAFRDALHGYLHEVRLQTAKMTSRLNDWMKGIVSALRPITIPQYDLLPMADVAERLEAEFAPLRSMLSRNLVSEFVDVNAPMLRMLESINAQAMTWIAEQAKQLVGSMSLIADIQRQIAASTVVKFNVGRLLPILPDIRELIRQRQQLLDQGADALEQEGFEFTEHLLDFALISSLAGISPQAQSAAVTNKLLAVTRTREFEEELIETILGTGRLKRRLHVVSRALAAHKDRNYVLAVPCLLAQVEGVYTDILILKGMAISQGGKLYARGSDGKIKINKKGDKIELSGISSKIDHSRFRQHPVLKVAVYTELNGLARDRNHILHGGKSVLRQGKAFDRAVFAAADIL